MIKHAFVFVFLVTAMSAQDTTRTNKARSLGIPEISREANGAIVSIVMSDRKGHPLAQGSGFLISKNGRVVTNYHVIRNGASAVVKLPDGAFFSVDGVLAFDKDRDIAIIKAHGENFRTVPLGDSDRLQVGEEVVAIGSPLSLESTVSNGIVSGIRIEERPSKGSLLDQVLAPAQERKLVQITAPISHGSSGGPLFKMTGEVVGITSSALIGGENLNFAVPINDARKLLRVPASQPLLAFPNEPEEEPEVHAAAQDPIILDEDGATGFAEIFSVEPACAGLTLMRQWSTGGHWIVNVATKHELYKDSYTQDPLGRTFISWWGLTHYTGKEPCSLGPGQQCPDVDKRFDVYALIKGTRDADRIPAYCAECTTSAPTSIDAGVKAVCTLVKGGGGGQVR